MLSQVRYSDLPLYQSIIKMGMDKGIEKGMEQGKQKGEASLLLRLLRLRFGELSEELNHQIETADVDSLSKWSSRLFTATSLDEVMK